MVKVLITGENGFIGRNLKNRLQLKNVQIISTNRLSLDLLSKKSVDDLFNKHGEFDVVLHCAIRGANRIIPKEPVMMYENIYSFENLQRYSDRINKFICFGSGAELDLNCYYGLSKYIISNRLKQFENGYNIKLFGVFGEDEYNWKFIKNTIICALNNEPIKITQNRFVDFFYIEDLCKIVEHYISSKTNLYKEINAVYSSDSITQSLLTLAKYIKERCNSKSNIIIEKEGLNIPYIGNDFLIKQMNIKFIGLFEGIENEINYTKKEEE